MPKAYLEDVKIALGKAVTKTVVGNPRNEEGRMGSLDAQSQRADVLEKLALLREDSELVYGDPSKIDVIDANYEQGAFLSPMLLVNKDPFHKTATHEVEAFGPITTLMPYDTLEDAVALTKMGKGSLVCSITTHDNRIARDFVLDSASHHGRILVLNRESAPESTGHGSPMPLLVHGGPGRAGGGEEMGGKRGVMHYLQRTAIQGSPTTLTAITHVYQYGAHQPEAEPHLFRHYVEDLQIGHTVFTHKPTVTETDICNFPNVNCPNF